MNDEPAGGPAPACAVRRPGTLDEYYKDLFELYDPPGRSNDDLGRQLTLSEVSLPEDAGMRAFFLQGAEAAKRDSPSDSCPFTRPDPRRLYWLKGYWMLMREKARRF